MPTEGPRHARHLRGLNLERVLGIAMARTGPLTRSELIEATGLSAPTVGSLVSQLTQDGLLRDLGTGPSRGGRRPSFMEFNARHGLVAAIDLGPTRTRLAVADLRGERLAHRIMPTPPGLGPKPLLAKIAGALKALLKETHLPLERLLAVAAGAPGAVDRERGMVVALAPNLKGWSQVPMGSLLRRALGAPVVVENDVNLAILGERWRGSARGHDTCAYVAVGTGIGAGIVVEGELHRGHHSLAGEIALMCMGPQYADVDFGSHGCLETLAGLRTLAARWTKAGGRDQDGWVAELMRSAQSGDRKARAIVDETATLIGVATANLCLVVDPSLIVLGGALIAQAPGLIDEVRRIVGRIIPMPSQIVPAALGEEASLWGALLLAHDEARLRLRARLREARVPA